MIGLIISGHGHFGTGLQSSLKLIAGESTNTQFIDFEESDSTDSLKKKYIQALSHLNNCDDILALTDLAGGSPFKTLVELSYESSQKIQVIGGSNLPMILEISMTKDIFSDLDSLCESALTTGKDSVVKFALVDHTEIEDEDGI
ncbi:PTS galactosamine/N-acetylgalactosamine transporter subunit IIA [uncultured Clostridium sp.]|uniref:PTS galactosamine/N-acetylgalactosamine transporter subunit IIA n=1 Tax=uncultured Clostridium sp. TaxID=59620 RepID=UPI00262E909D|nr:PTS galactosamine/N-acetylgalactosamine transporter subunit IIA [uncultured Clostridium sp.]